MHVLKDIHELSVYVFFKYFAIIYFSAKQYLVQLLCAYLILHLWNTHAYIFS